MKLLILTLMTLFVSCASNVKEERFVKIENQLRKLIVENRLTLDELRNEMASLNGKIEEVEYYARKDRDKIKENNSSEIDVMKEKVNYIEKDSKEQKKTIQANSDFDTLLREHLDQLQDGKLNKAREGLTELIDYSNISVFKRAVALYNLAVLEYRLKNYDLSKEYFMVIDKNVDNFKVTRYQKQTLYYLGLINFKEKNCSKVNKYFSQLKKIDAKSSWFKKAKKLEKCIP